MEKSKKPILVLDFDGVLHSYSSGWQGADVVADSPVEGAQEFCARVLELFDVWIISARCKQDGGTPAIIDWLTKHKFPYGLIVSLDGAKPAAFVTLDDRAITFNGEWPSAEELARFEPWYRRD